MTPDRAQKRRAAYRRGLSAETKAAWALRLRGYRILAVRYRTPAGEIDLVARRGRMLVFVEVKARSDEAAAIDAVSRRAAERIRRAADLWIARHPALADCERRFDIAVVAPMRWPRFLPGAFDGS